MSGLFNGGSPSRTGDALLPPAAAPAAAGTSSASAFAVADDDADDSRMSIVRKGEANDEDVKRGSFGMGRPSSFEPSSGNDEEKFSVIKRRKRSVHSRDSFKPLTDATRDTSYNSSAAALEAIRLTAQSPHAGPRRSRSKSPVPTLTSAPAGGANNAGAAAAAAGGASRPRQGKKQHQQKLPFPSSDAAIRSSPEDSDDDEEAALGVLAARRAGKSTGVTNKERRKAKALAESDDDSVGDAKVASGGGSKSPPKKKPSKHADRPSPFQSPETHRDNTASRHLPPPAAPREPDEGLMHIPKDSTLDHRWVL